MIGWFWSPIRQVSRKEVCPEVSFIKDPLDIVPQFEDQDGLAVFIGTGPAPVSVSAIIPSDPVTGLPIHTHALCFVGGISLTDVDVHSEIFDALEIVVPFKDRISFLKETPDGVGLSGLQFSRITNRLTDRGIEPAPLTRTGSDFNMILRQAIVGLDPLLADSDPAKIRAGGHKVGV